MTKIVNLTPHVLTIRTATDSLTFEPSGSVARVEMNELHLDTVMKDGVEIPVVAQQAGEVIGLPEPEEGCYFVVSRVVADNCPQRTDLLFPTHLIRDSEGSIIAAQAFGTICWPGSEPRHLVLLCGGNPMPLLLAAMTIYPTEVTLVHSRETEAIALRLGDALVFRGLQVATRLVDDATSPQSISATFASIEGTWKLDYTGGTKAMAVHARAAFDALPNTDPAWATYVDYASGVLRHDDGRTTPLVEGGLNLAQIAELHGVKLLAGATFEWEPSLAKIAVAELLKAAATPGNSEERIKKYRAAYANNARLMVNRDTGTELKTGEWMEWLAFHLAELAVGNEVDYEVVQNQILRFDSERVNAELDVVTRVDSQVCLLTCGSVLKMTGMLTELKLKAMEAMQRARQIGGDRTRVGLVCLADDQQVDRLEEQLFGGATSPKHRIFGVAALSRMLDDDSALKDFRRWLSGE